jgi:hypothetical protein
MTVQRLKYRTTHYCKVEMQTLDKPDLSKERMKVCIMDGIEFAGEF